MAGQKLFPEAVHFPVPDGEDIQESKGLLPAWSACVTFKEHLVGYFVNKKAGLDGPLNSCRQALLS